MAKADGRSYVKQSDVPRCSLEDALRVAMALAENFASEPTRPLRVAEAMGLAPNGGRFRNLCGASVAYGLTEGGSYASEIALTDLWKQIVRPTKEWAARGGKAESSPQSSHCQRLFESIKGYIPRSLLRKMKAVEMKCSFRALIRCPPNTPGLAPEMLYFPYTHDLDMLRDLLPKGWHVKEEQPDLASLSEWAVGARYPNDVPDAAAGHPQQLVEQARSVVYSVREDLAERGFVFDV